MRLSSIRAVPVISGLLFLGIYTSSLRAETEEIAQVVQQYFTTLESDLVALSARPEMYARKVSMAIQPFNKIVKKRTEITTLIRTNSRGIVINEKDREGGAGAKYRDLSSQRWFQTVSSSQTYYGQITTSRGNMYLFWCIPILSKSQSGTGRFGGCIIARIQFEDAMKNAAREAKRPFVILQGTNAIFSHEWKNSYEQGDPVSIVIKGLDGLMLSGKKTETVGEVKGPSAPIQDSSRGEGRKSRKGKFPLGLILLAGGAGILLAIGGRWFHKVNKKRQAELMDKIDREHSPVEYGETVVIDRQKLLQDTAQPPQSNGVMREYIPASAQSATGGTTKLRPADPYKETRIMSLDQMRAEVEEDINQKINSVLTERTKQIRKEVYAEARLMLLKNMKTYSVALGQQIEQLNHFVQTGMVRGPADIQTLMNIVSSLQRIQDSIEGKNQKV